MKLVTIGALRERERERESCSLKNEKGSITLFVLIAMIFFVAIAMTAYVSASSKLQGQNAELERIKASYEQDLSEEGLADLYKQLTTAKTETKPELASTNETKPWLPTGCEITNNDLSTGVTIKDSNDNEWTWVVVPKSITASATTDNAIETALRTYADTVVTRPDGYSDTWYDGCGLTETQYAEKKSKMLNSIKDNGGFWIGKYEVGFTSGGPRSYKNSETEKTTQHDLLQQPVIKPNAFPYTWITIKQAENMAEQLSQNLLTEERNGSLMYGIQWDLMIAYLYKSGAITQEEINKGTTWGNFYNTELTVVNSNTYQSVDYGATWNILTGTKTADKIMLTTDTAITNKKLNISDVAGNLWEWTLEFYGENSVFRGASYLDSGESGSVATRGLWDHKIKTNANNYNLGFRPTIY